MTQQIAERMTVSATVKSRAEVEDGFVLELDIPQFRSDYPTKVTRVREATAKLLPPRVEPYMVVIVRENLKKGKQGTRAYDYYWGLEGLATPAETAAFAGVASKPQAPPRQSWDDRTVDIEAAWAINQARELMQWEEADSPPDGRFLELETLVSNAQWFLDAKLMLTNAMRSGQRIGSQDSPSEAHDPAGGQPEAARPPVAQESKALVSPIEAFNYGLTQGYKNRQQMLAVPGVQAAFDAKDGATMVTLLIAARKAQ